MTYCLALKLRDGLVFASDSRTTAGVDYISTYRKMHVFQPSQDRLIVVLTSGNLATTQEVLDNLRRDLTSTEATENLARVSYLFEAARYVGKVLCTVVQPRPGRRRICSSANSNTASRSCHAWPGPTCHLTTLRAWR
jgi:putative proteasome-type protease